MADDKRGREKQARDADVRQRMRAIREELERTGEPEPPVDVEALAEAAAALESVPFPATGREVVEAIGDVELDAREGPMRADELLPDADAETFDSPTEVRFRLQRPTVASGMKRVVEAADEARDVELSGSQRDAYEKTFTALEDLAPTDEDEGIPYICDWILDRLAQDGELPGSRSVRREAATFARENGYPVRKDEWLGV
ncbi:hypothetical protein [Haloarchaeobius sp. FL176]|uniref:DUF5789 family protein n=1 Tax=Haloarchaeobius sp. FL176 TaxID=2967129 RepID=UPI002148102A|nr:hypothetical protein [Haloarchaeobius sp. FL176]